MSVHTCNPISRDGDRRITIWSLGLNLLVVVVQQVCTATLAERYHSRTLLHKRILSFCFFFSWDIVSLHSPGWPITPYVDQAGLEFTESCLFCFLNARIISVCHQVQPERHQYFNWGKLPRVEMLHSAVVFFWVGNSIAQCHPLQSKNIVFF